MKELQDDILRCMRCGFCRAVCPVFEETKLESGVARGKLAILEGLIEDELELDESVVDKIFQCTLCRNCNEECPAGVEIDSVILKARAEMFDKVDLPIYAHIAENVLEFGNPFAEEGEIEEEREAEFAYFPGCTSQYRATEIAKSVGSVLTKLGVDFQVTKNMCCGSPLIMMGRDSDARQVMKKNVQDLAKRNIKTLLVSCAGCYHALAHYYKDELKDAGISVLHLTQFLNDLVEKHGIKFSKLDKTITYHDPCHLGRHSGIFEEPRRIISSIPDVRFVEMSRHGRNARCCGAGGDLGLGYVPLSARIAKRRISDAVETGAEILVTACPTCYRTLSHPSKDLEVMDISMLVDRQLGG